MQSAGTSCGFHHGWAAQLSQQLEHAFRILLDAVVGAIDWAAEEALKDLRDRGGWAAEEKQPGGVAVQIGDKVAAEALGRAGRASRLADGESDRDKRRLDIESVCGGKEPLHGIAECLGGIRLPRKQAVRVLVYLLRIHLVGPRETRPA